MPKIIEILLEEHQNIEKLLCVLEHELELFDRSERSDYEILQTIIQYFQDYPESCHNPKEEMIFEKLKARDPAAAKGFGNVEADHEVEAKRLRSCTGRRRRPGGPGIPPRELPPGGARLHRTSTPTPGKGGTAAISGCPEGLAIRRLGRNRRTVG